MILTTALLLTQLRPPVENPGQMFVVGPRSRTIMPLERTSVTADVAGMGARVTVRQSFVNPSTTPIEALYTFPLPPDAAVDTMRIRIGDRTIDGSVMRRAAAKAAYDAAKAKGQTAALLDQETDNVFTQSVANVMPGGRITVEISYVQLLKFEDGEFEFSYPMVVGPRYMGAGSPPKVATATLPAGVRSGANVDLAVTLHGGAPIQEFHSVLHAVTARRTDAETVRIELARKDEIPNRDFVLHYRTASKGVQEAAFTTWDERTGGHFALVLAPPPKPDPADRAPKEMEFVMDQSGSQSGFPIDKSKELTLQLMKTMGPDDTFNVLGFSNEVNPLWPEPRPNTPANVAEAKAFVQGLEANGGTQMEKAVVAALSPATDPNRLRIVLFNTDGFAGQESTILSDVQRLRGTSRLFTFGISNSVNYALINAMSVEGRGASETVTLAEDAAAARDRFAKRLESPLLVNVAVGFAGGDVTDVTPAHLPDVFSARPVVVYGRYTKPGHTRLTLTGRSGREPWSRTIDLDLPKTTGDGSSVASLWARARLAEMKADGYTARAMGKPPENEETMTKLALDYRLLSETTSFVAIDRSVSNPNGNPTSVTVPLDMPQGVTMGMAAAPAGGVRGRSNNATSISALKVQGLVSTLLGGGEVQSGGSSGKVRRRIYSAGGGFDPEGVFVELKEGTHSVAVAKSLLEAKGPIAVRVVVTAISQACLEALRKAGLRVGSNDGATEVFGTLTAQAIREIAKLDFVTRIVPLR